MEQRFATSSVGHKCAGMCAYINRENVFSRYMQKEYKHAYRGKDDVIDTYIYRALRQMGDVGISSATGFFQSIVGFVLVLISNKLANMHESDAALF